MPTSRATSRTSTARPLVDERRVARDHRERLDPAERGDDVFRYAIGKVLLARIAPEVPERQNGERRSAAMARRPPPSGAAAGSRGAAPSRSSPAHPRVSPVLCAGGDLERQIAFLDQHSCQPASIRSALLTGPSARTSASSTANARCPSATGLPSRCSLPSASANGPKVRPFSRPCPHWRWVRMAEIRATGNRSDRSFQPAVPIPAPCISSAAPACPE